MQNGLDMCAIQCNIVPYVGTVFPICGTFYLSDDVLESGISIWQKELEIMEQCSQKVALFIIAITL